MRQYKYALLGAALCISNSVQAVDLSTLYKEMIDSLPGLTASSAQVDAGKARAKQAKGSLLPQISMGSTLNRTRHKSTALTYYNGERYNLNVTQSIFDREKFENKKLYDSLADQNYDNYLAFKSAASIDLVERYVLVLSSEDKLAQVVKERRLTSRQLQQLRSMYERQLALLTDVLDVEARLDGLYAQEISAINDTKIARERLAELVGRDVIEPLDKFSETISFAKDSENTKQYWTEHGLTNNHQLKALGKKINAVKADVKKAGAGHLPTVSMQLNAQKSNIGFENSSAQQNESYVASLNFSIPIYSGGTTSARQSEKRAELVEANARYEEERRTIVRDIREAFLNVAANKANIKASKKAVSSAQKAYEASSKGFEYGTVTVIDVLDSQRNVLESRNEYRQKQYDYAVNWLNLLRLSGKLDDKSIAQANSWLIKK